MRWRPLPSTPPADTDHKDLDPWPATYGHVPEYQHVPETVEAAPRTQRAQAPRTERVDLVELLARLEAATRLRDAAAAARILDRLSTSDDGAWLLRQCAAAGLRDVAALIADPDTDPAARVVRRSIGVA